MSEELKPCPFCNYVPDPTWKTEIDIYCEECGIRALGTEKETAQEQWNNRPIEDALRAENERLRALLHVKGLNESIKDMEGNLSILDRVKTQNGQLRILIADLVHDIESKGLRFSGYLVERAREALKEGKP